MAVGHQLTFAWVSASRQYLAQPEYEPHQKRCWGCDVELGECEDDNCEAGEDHAVPDLCLQCLPAELRLKD